MRTFNTLLCCTLIAPASTALGQSYGELTINDVRARFHAHGLIGHNLGSSTAAFEVPQGEGAHALYSAGLWAAGVTSDQTLHLSAMKYEANGQGDYYTGPLTTDGTASTDAAMMEAYDEVWEATSEQVERHLAYFTCLGDPGCDVSVEFPDGYEIPPGFFEWPAINSTPGFATSIAWAIPTLASPRHTPSFEQRSPGKFDRVDLPSTRHVKCDASPPSRAEGGVPRSTPFCCPHGRSWRSWPPILNDRRTDC